MTRKIVLIRHGQAEGAEGRLIGHTDLPLSAEGVRQSHALAIRLQDYNITQIYSSDLMRTVETAGILADDLAVGIEAVQDERLREISLGIWEGILFEEIKIRFPSEYDARGKDIWNYRVPEGESFADVEERAMDFMQEIQKNDDDDTMVVVTHAGVIRCVLKNVLSMDGGHIFSLQPHYGGCVVLSADKGGIALHGFNL